MFVIIQRYFWNSYWYCVYYGGQQKNKEQYEKLSDVLNQIAHLPYPYPTPFLGRNFPCDFLKGHYIGIKNQDGFQA